MKVDQQIYSSYVTGPVKRETNQDSFQYTLEGTESILPRKVDKCALVRLLNILYFKDVFWKIIFYYEITTVITSPKCCQDELTLSSQFLIHICTV
ncbi:MAG: hypothetical protein WBB23_15820, partial [Desulforhopalus sp.]